MSSSPDNSSSADTKANRRPDDSLQTLMLYRMGRSTAWMAFFALVIAIAGGAGGYFLWNQLNVMQDESDQLEDMADKVEQSLKASQAQSVALNDTLKVLSQQLAADSHAARASDSPDADRPWVGVDSVSMGPLAPNVKPVVTANIRNSARTPALNVKVSLKTSVGPTQPGINADDCATCSQQILLPNMSLRINASPDTGALTPLSINRVKIGEATIWLTGWISYKDLSAHLHTTQVCMTYVPRTSSFSACGDGNHFD